MRPFRELRVWQESHNLALAVYDLTNQFPATEVFGLTSQMRRAATSVPMNIAEGSVKADREFRRALLIALGSASELHYQFILARDLGYLAETRFGELEASTVRIQKMLQRFMSLLAPTRPTADSRRPMTTGRPTL